MELMQLEMFVAVVEEGSVRCAAERVYRTQPAVSIAVRKLEAELDVPLFDRSKRYAFRLTRAGESLFSYAKRMLSLRSEAVSQLESIASLHVGRLSIGANESISLHLLPTLAHAFLQRHPGVRIELKCERSESLLTDLKARRIDLAVVSFRPEDAELESSFLAEDELVLITSPRHVLARKGTVQFQDLREESVLTMDVSQPSPWHKSVADAYLRHQIPFHLQVENAPIEAIKKMVIIGLGVGFVPRLCVGDEVARGDLAIVGVDGFREVRSVWLVRRWAMRSQAADAFVEFALRSRNEIEARRNTGSSNGSSNSEKSNKVVSVNRRG